MKDIIRRIWMYQARDAGVIAYFVVFVYLLIRVISMIVPVFEEDMLVMSELLIIYMFAIMGLVSFYESFYLLQQNGISRKTMFVSRFTAMVIAAGVMEILRSILSYMANKFLYGERFQIFAFRWYGGTLGFEKHILYIQLYLLAFSAGVILFLVLSRLRRTIAIFMSVFCYLGVIVIVQMSKLRSYPMINKFAEFADLLINREGGPWRLIGVSFLLMWVLIFFSWRLFYRRERAVKKKIESAFKMN